jgi:hypothetical protein
VTDSFHARQRRIEARIGQLLGEPMDPHKSGSIRGSYHSNDLNNRTIHEFRTLARGWGRIADEEWRLGGYVKLAIDDRREAVRELTDQGHSQREVAAITGLSQPTVQRALADDSNESKTALSDGAGDSDGEARREQNRQLVARSSAESAVRYAMRCGELLLAKKAELGHGEFLPWVEANCEFTVRHAQRYMAASGKSDTRVAFSSLRELLADGKHANSHRTECTGNQEWYTPAAYIEAAPTKRPA